MAATDALRCVRNAPYRATFPLTNTADALVPAAAGLASNVSVESAAYAITAGSVTEIGATGIYYLDLTETELITTSNASVYVTSSDATDHFMEIPFEPCLESGVAQGATSTSIKLRTGASVDTNYYSGMVVEIVRGTGVGQTRTGLTYNGGTKDLNVDRAWVTNPDAASVYKLSDVGVKTGTDIVAESNMVQISGSAAASVLLGGFTVGMAVLSSVNDASPTTTGWICASGLEPTDDHYNAAICLFTSGVNVGLCRQVIDWDEAADTITTNAWPQAPANGDTFALFGKVF